LQGYDMLELTSISKTFSDVQVLDSLNLSVAPGSRTAIVGPSGSGKTTLLRILAGFETPDTGRIVMQGRTLFDENSFVPAHLRGIGYVPQEGALFPHLNVADNIAWGLDGTRHEKRQRVEVLMDMVSLDRQLATHWPHEISGGQQQRVALARALMQQAKVILADEPIASLDPESARIVMDTLRDINQNDGITVVVTLHQVDYALRYCERIVALRQGHVFYDGSSQQFDNERFDHLYRSINRVEENAQAA